MSRGYCLSLPKFPRSMCRDRACRSQSHCSLLCENVQSRRSKLCEVSLFHSFLRPLIPSVARSTTTGLPSVHVPCDSMERGDRQHLQKACMSRGGLVQWMDQRQLLFHWTGAGGRSDVGGVEGFRSINGSMPSQDAGFWLIREVPLMRPCWERPFLPFSAATQITCWLALLACTAGSV